MEPFLKQIATHYYKEHGEEIHRLCFVFPGRRAGLFFKRHLSHLADKPLFSPKATTLKDLLLGLSPAEELDRTALLFELYNSYREIAPEAEPFDQFLFWGDIILKDFNEIDRHLIPATMLYSNLKDYRELDSDFSFLNERQVEAIRSFWDSFSPTKGGETEDSCQQNFLEFWQLLSPLYTRFQSRLDAQGKGYAGMMVRRTAELLKKRETSVRELLQSAYRGNDEAPKKYVFAGLLALSPAEEYILSRMKDEGLCEFCFDDESPLIQSGGSLACTILDHDKEVFGQTFGWKSQSTAGGEDASVPTKTPTIRVIRTASEIVQAKLLPRLIEELYPAGYTDSNGIETAILLPDERMLMPVLNSLVDTVERINVTMGYPLAQSSISLLADKWIKAQANMRTIHDVLHFRTEAAIDLLNSLLLSPLLTDKSRRLMKTLEGTKTFYISATELQCDSLTKHLFTPPADGSALLDTLFALLESIAQSIEVNRPSNEEEDKAEQVANIELEQLYYYRNTVNRLKGLISEAAMTMSPQSAALLLQGLITGTAIPFEGEPLIGVQIMSMEETRALDFEHLIILSANEGKLPSRTHETTMIPYTLRRGYGLPVNEINEATQIYDFFRLLPRAKRVTMLYDARTDQSGGGEESRYIRQMRYLFDTPIEVQELHLIGSLPNSPHISVPKEGETLKKLYRFLETPQDEHASSDLKLPALSASSINTYAACPLRFYYEYVRGIREENAPEELMAANDFGTVVHRAMELIYQPCCSGGEVSTQMLSQWLDPANAIIARTVRQAYSEEYLHTKDVKGQLTGLNHLYCVMIEKYVRRILEHDKSIAPFRYIASEKRVRGSLALSNGHRVRLQGVIDRIDEFPGEVRRIVDYKSGGVSASLKSWDSLFSHINGKPGKDQPSAISQTLFYAFMMRTQMEKDGEKRNLPLCPTIYSFQSLYKDKDEYTGVICVPESGGGYSSLTDFDQIRDTFEEKLRRRLDQMFDPDIPFAGTDDTKVCSYCPFVTICGK